MTVLFPWIHEIQEGIEKEKGSTVNSLASTEFKISWVSTRIVSV